MSTDGFADDDTPSPTLTDRAPAGDGEPSEIGQRERSLAYRRRALLGLYALGAGAYLATSHFPPSEDALFLLIGAGLLVGSVGEPKRSVWLRLVIDWLPLFLLLSVYDLLRRRVSDVAGAHLFPQLHAERWLFDGNVPTLVLQHAFLTPADPHWWDYVAFVVYLSHFVVPIGVAAVLWKFAYPRFHRYAVLFVTLTFAGFATYALYPAVPPWMASLRGSIGPTTKVIDDVWIHLGLRSAASVLSSNSHLANPVAAMPSLHAAYPFLLMLFFWRSAGRYRWLLPLYPLAMSFTLVYSAEHFVIDILAGWLYAVVVFIVGNWAFDRCVKRNRSRAGWHLRRAGWLSANNELGTGIDSPTTKNEVDTR